MDMARVRSEVSRANELTVRVPRGGWDQAVHIAAARLNEGWILPETRCQDAAAEELAALLCAYAA